ESDPGDDPRSWPMVASGLSPANSGGAANGGGDGGDGHGHGGRKAPVRMASRLKSPPRPPRVHRPTYSPDSVGYRIAVIDVKVSMYHPKGSAIAANKEAVMAGLTRGLHARARKVNQLMLLESLIESKVACEVLIPQPPSPSLTPPSLADAGDSLRPGSASSRSRLNVDVTVNANPASAPGSGSADGRGGVPSPQAPSSAGLGPASRDPTGYGASLSSAFVTPGSAAASGEGGGNGGSSVAHAGASNDNVRVASLRRSMDDA
ncbi:unnamed protein product, partial [Laminaria digitata]